MSLNMLQEKQLHNQSTNLVNNNDLFFGDETINAYMNLITERSPTTVYAFDTFFFPNLMQKGYSSISRWTKKIDIFEKKKLFIPVHLSGFMHWCLIYVDFEKKEVKYYDSLRGRREFNLSCLKLVFDYLYLEKYDKKNQYLDVRNYWLMNMSKCPKQKNNYDCGVFICMYAEYLSRDEPLEFSQEDMKRFRRQIKHEIKEKKLINSVNCD